MSKWNSLTDDVMVMSLFVLKFICQWKFEVKIIGVLLHPVATKASSVARSLKLDNVDLD